jgi:hypothetical protein
LWISRAALTSEKSSSLGPMRTTGPISNQSCISLCLTVDHTIDLMQVLNPAWPGSLNELILRIPACPFGDFRARDPSNWVCVSKVDCAL